MANKGSPKHRQRQKHAPNATAFHGIWWVKGFDGRPYSFRSDLEFLHFAYLEGDTSLGSIAYEPSAEAFSAYGDLPSQFKTPSLAERVDGGQELRVLTTSYAPPEAVPRVICLFAEAHSAKVVITCKSEVLSHAVRTQNWIRLLASFNRCSNLVTSNHIQAVVNRVIAAGQMRVADLFASLAGIDLALLAGATALALRSRLIVGDLDQMHWSLHTHLRPSRHD